MPETKPFNSGLSKEQITEAFRRALNDMTDEQIEAKFAEISAKITGIEERLTTLENPET